MIELKWNGVDGWQLDVMEKHQCILSTLFDDITEQTQGYAADELVLEYGRYSATAIALSAIKNPEELFE